MEELFAYLRYNDFHELYLQGYGNRFHYWIWVLENWDIVLLKRMKRFMLLSLFIILFILVDLFVRDTGFLISFFPQEFNAIYILFFICYLVLNLFFYFSNIYRFGTYTSSIQRFWKRTFMLFWIIEGFLFLIFIYLYLIAPQEVRFFVDSVKQGDAYIFCEKSLFRNTIFYLVLCYTFYLVLYWKKYNININVCLIFQFFIYLVLYFDELWYFICTLINYSQKKNTNIFLWNNQYSFNNLATLNTVDLLDNFIINKRTENYFIGLICFLKYWHVVLILIGYVFLLYNKFTKKQISFCLISSNFQNTLYLYVFSLTQFIMYIKYLYIYNFTFCYFWFWENYSLYNSLNFFVFELFY